jgi:diguanylate cyclase (GGDEF)-like protein
MPVFRVGGSEILEDLTLSLSVGIASYPDPRVRTEADLIALADEAMYLAKQHGRNCVMVG